MSLWMVVLTLVWYVGLLVVIAVVIVAVRVISRHETLREALLALLH
jgi:hypothetical protein